MFPGETIRTGAPSTCAECHVSPKLQVCSSPAGFYLGTYCDCGPYSRESEYYSLRVEAEKALASGDAKWRSM